MSFASVARIMGGARQKTASSLKIETAIRVFNSLSLIHKDKLCKFSCP